ncbi:MAG: aromatic ring-hydroxylating oxygenase subunit alpha [Tepidisphaeraceae bacterium]
MALLSPRPSVDEIRDRVLAVADLPLKQGRTFPPQAYTDPGYYQLEVDHVLKRQWLCMGHVSQIPNAGDYFNLDLLGEPMVVVRGKDMDVRVLSRVCPHRGMDVNPTEYGRPAEGNARFLICPYHFWTFDLDGRCKGAPEMQHAEGFSRRETGLSSFRSEVWHGFIFVTFSSVVAPVAQLYAHMGEKLAELELEQLQIVTSLDWDSPFNWKVIVENFAECYHHCGAHIKTFEPMFPAKTCWSEPEHPHYTVAHLPLVQTLADEVRKGESSVRSFIDFPNMAPDHKLDWYVYVGFPTFLLFVAPDRVYWYRILPEGPGRVKLMTTMMVHPEAKKRPDYEQKLAAEVELLKTFHLEDMEVCVAVQKGMEAGSFAGGRLSHLEMPIWHIQRYLARQLRAAEAEPETFGPVPYAPAHSLPVLV